MKAQSHHRLLLTFLSMLLNLGLCPLTQAAPWISTSPLHLGRYSHTATLLPNGKVLLAGGQGTVLLSSAELYDPGSESWNSVGAMATGRKYHTATLLPNGDVLVTGGYNGAALASAEVYDRLTGTWATAGGL